jgi:hypothetical protein
MGTVFMGMGTGTKKYTHGLPVSHPNCGTDILFTSQDVADPISLLQEYVAQHDGHHGARAALFLHENGSHPTRSWFDMKFFTILDHRFGGHSPRAGYTTFLASLGVSETIIQAIGRWSSKAWKIYVWENPSIRAAQQLAASCLQQHG